VPLRTWKARGVIPRSLEYLFSVIAHQQDYASKKQFLCRCSCLEIYQEQIFDLLDTASQGLRLRENMKKDVYVDGLIEQVICNPRDAYQLLIKGWLNRRVAASSMNREGSRSHAVFTVKIESKEEVGGFQKSNISQINLIDLAGSERQKATNTDSTRLKEAGSINKSLSVLGNVIMSLSYEKKTSHPLQKLQINIFVEGFNWWKNKDKNDSLCSSRLQVLPRNITHLKVCQKCQTKEK
ncbi:kinesin-like protein KIF15, partial [Biomphalaria glabrata]